MSHFGAVLYVTEFLSKQWRVQGGCFGCWSTPHTRTPKKKRRGEKRKKEKERKKKKEKEKERKEPMITKNIWAPPYPC